MTSEQLEIIEPTLIKRLLNHFDTTLVITTNITVDVATFSTEIQRRKNVWPLNSLYTQISYHYNIQPKSCEALYCAEYLTK